MSTLIYDLFNEIFKMGKWGVTLATWKKDENKSQAVRYVGLATWKN